ncbi:MAG: hypothetical protein HFG47_11355 [Lachnospiraceae bacterium]|nr:hypothetical protein [Lachnospiraceae bacterium]
MPYRDELALMVYGEHIDVKLQGYAATAAELNAGNQIYSAMVAYGLLAYENREGKIVKIIQNFIKISGRICITYRKYNFPLKIYVQYAILIPGIKSYAEMREHSITTEMLRGAVLFLLANFQVLEIAPMARAERMG